MISDDDIEDGNVDDDDDDDDVPNDPLSLCSSLGAKVQWGV